MDHGGDFRDAVLRGDERTHNDRRKRTERCNDVLLRHKSRDGGDGEHPPEFNAELRAEAERREERLNEHTDRTEDTLVHAEIVAVLIDEELPAPIKARKEPDDDGRGEDDGERLLDIVLRLIPQVHHQALEAGRVICGKLHDEGRHFAAHRRRAHENDGDDRRADTQQVHAHGDDVRVPHAEVCDDRARDSGQNGQFGAAREEWNDAYGGGALLVVGKRTGVDHRGQRAAEAHDHGHERSAGETELAEDAVENERDTRHVTGIFENGEEQEEREDLGNKPEHREHAAQNAVDHKAADPCGRVGASHFRKHVDPFEQPVQEIRQYDAR